MDSKQSSAPSISPLCSFNNALVLNHSPRWRTRFSAEGGGSYPQHNPGRFQQSSRRTSGLLERTSTAAMVAESSFQNRLASAIRWIRMLDCPAVCASQTALGLVKASPSGIWPTRDSYSCRPQAIGDREQSSRAAVLRSGSANRVRQRQLFALGASSLCSGQQDTATDVFFEDEATRITKRRARISKPSADYSELFHSASLRGLLPLMGVVILSDCEASARLPTDGVLPRMKHQVRWGIPRHS